MQRLAAILTIICSLTLSGCATYDTPNGKAMADPKFCQIKGLCPVLIGAAIVGVGAVATH
jgi:outer membrane lipoprotein SlyB